MQTNGQTIIDRFEQYAPRSLAVEGDPIGVQIGDPKQTVKRVLVTLDVRPETVQEAIDAHCDMIFAHHPAVFVPAKNLDYTTPQNAMYATVIKHDILVYGAHTNLDNAQPGMNDWLASQLGLQQVTKLHSHDELDGMGRIGQLNRPQSLQSFIDDVKDDFELTGLRVIARRLDREISTVAVLGGSAQGEYRAAQAAGADVYVTGDVSYHIGHDMLAADMPVLDVGHHVEQVMKGKVTNLLKQWAQDNNWDVEIIASKLNTDPFTFM